jgi:hypothetical protein
MQFEEFCYFQYVMPSKLADIWEKNVSIFIIEEEPMQEISMQQAARRACVMVFSCLCYLKMEETCSIETVDFP